MGDSMKYADQQRTTVAKPANSTFNQPVFVHLIRVNLDNAKFPVMLLA
jgi:hypothetical protein